MPPASAPQPATAPSAAVLHQLYGTWIDCAEDAYSRAAHSEPFCTALAEYVNASSEWRKELQASVEHSAKLLDLPTRSEINTLTQRLIAVEHELRARPSKRPAKSRNGNGQTPARATQEGENMTPGSSFGALAALAAATPGAAGCSEREVVWQSGKIKLFRYRPIARPAASAPLLIVYALVNRPYMMDLQEDRSLIRGLLNEGLDVYLIDWGYPDGADRFTTLADYIDEQLAGCVQQILEKHHLDHLNMLGVCQGGVLSLCFSALHPQHIKNLITMVTPVDFHTPADLLSKWARKIDVAALVGDGNVSGDVLNQLFLSLMPFRLTQQKYVDLLAGNPDRAAPRTSCASNNGSSTVRIRPAPPSRNS